ncbi:TonB-dependent receptor [Pelomonas saccharophila]|uniref:TonB-dependent receptor n=1 Tax=Roseateles saccharophilus TaxID=304 RepID=A0ABU1YF02_ROSSA|nr:TonB-dependent receptor [Roseateles saccharophilus]MDR7267439.1 TonB-dependent receptor [Roseateles saccharophilus]
MRQLGLVLPVAGAVLLAPAALWAQKLEPVIVTGTRASVESAAERKRRSDDLIDAVLAEEIHRLPDLSVADAVQRITGVQITRDRGEASVASVRGLVQVETTLNGRELFTAGFGRALDYADLPSDLLAGIDVYKSSAASRIEGGLGGTVDLRTRRPFDFRASTLALSARQLYGDLVGRGAGQFSLLYGGRTVTGAGEAAVLLNLVLQDRAYREDQKGTGAPMLCSARAASGCRLDLVAGEDTVAPSSTSESASLGRRRRSAASLMLGWRPAAAFDLYAEAHFAKLSTRQDTQQINVGPNFAAGSGFDPASVALFAGTHDVQRISWTNAPVSILGFARDTVDRTHQVAAGGTWSGDGGLRLSADLSHTRSFNRLFFAGPTLAATAARFSHDLAGDAPGTAVAGTDLADPAKLRYVSLAYRVRPLRGSLLAGRTDAEWQLDGGMLERVAVGWRHSRREADNAPNLIFGDVAVPGVSAAIQPGRTAIYPYAPFLDGRAVSIEGYLTDTLADARDPVALRQAFGITTPLPTAGGPLGVWRIRETTDAAYAETGWRVPALALDGQAGLRLVHTRATLSGNRSVPSSASIEPLAIDTATTDWLPSASLRWRLDGAWQLRAAASRTLTRPDFNLLSPSITLTPNSVNPQLNQGTAGNPALRPMRSTNADLAAEAHFGAGHAAALTLFWKHVDGFVATLSQAEQHDGQLYQVSRPYNADAGRIRGAELSYQRFLDFLPGAWRGLGLQANATFVDSSTYDRVLRANVALPNLSRRSANLIGLYEYGAWSARLAWNWRSNFPSGTVSVVGIGALQATTHAYGWLDASLRWRLSEGLSLSLDGGNLLGTLRRSYFGVPTRPQTAWANDRQVGISLGLHL